MKLDIGLEIHVRLNTKSKLWSGAANTFSHTPNTNISAVDLGIPGACPVLNKAAVEKALRLGMLLNCHINKINTFDRKHYIYPDLPSGYQITQFQKPIAMNGEVMVGDHKILISQIHIESDAGKIVNEGNNVNIDYNRVGCPLIEIVTGVCFSSSEQVVKFLNYLIRLLKYMNISNCEMQKGDLRCDVNISCREKLCDPLGMRGEIKNLGSISEIKKAIDLAYNTKFTTTLTEPSTIQYDVNNNTLTKMRFKCPASDYCYLHDGNIAPNVISDEMIDDITKNMPQHPDDIEKEMLDMSIHSEVIKTILDNYELYLFYRKFSNPNVYIANICANIIASNFDNIQKHDTNTINKLIKDIELVVKYFPTKISINNGQNIIKNIISNMNQPSFDLQKDIDSYIMNDNYDEILVIVQKVIAENHGDWMQYCSGDNKVYNTLLGKIKSHCKNISIAIVAKIIQELSQK